MEAAAEEVQAQKDPVGAMPGHGEKIVDCQRRGESVVTAEYTEAEWAPAVVPVECPMAHDQRSIRNVLTSDVDDRTGQAHTMGNNVPSSSPRERGGAQEERECLQGGTLRWERKPAGKRGNNGSESGGQREARCLL